MNAPEALAELATKVVRDILDSARFATDEMLKLWTLRPSCCCKRRRQSVASTRIAAQYLSFIIFDRKRRGHFTMRLRQNYGFTVCVTFADVLALKLVSPP